MITLHLYPESYYFKFAFFLGSLQIISSEKGPVVAPIITGGAGQVVQVNYLYNQQDVI